MSWWSSVATTAINMPHEPSRLPSRACLGDDRKSRVRMKQTDATRYASGIQEVRSNAIACSVLPRLGRAAAGAALLEHLEHAVGDHEAADRVDGGAGDGDETEPRGDDAPRRSRRD